MPDGASTVAVNLTVVNPAAAGSLTAFNCDLPKPATPNVAFAKGQTASNLALVELAGSGNICLSSTAATNVLVDADGYGSHAGGAAVHAGHAGADLQQLLGWRVRARR